MKFNFFKKSQLASPPNEQRDNHRIARDPYIDWVLMFNAFLILSAGFIFVGFVVYMNMDAEFGKSPKEAGADLPKLDEAALNAVLADFESRKLERSMMGQGYRGVGDPSL